MAKRISIDWIFNDLRKDMKKATLEATQTVFMSL